MFGKRTTPVPPQRSGETPRPEKPTAGKLTAIVVPRCAIEQANDPKTAYRLVGAIVKYVNALTREGLYNRLEIPGGAIQAYHADYCLAQVNNGGHAQFIHNSGENLKHSLLDVPAALSAMQATAHQAIFARFKDWTEQFTDAKTMLAALSGDTAAPLWDLDRLFYETETTSPMATLSARWIASWPELRVVADAEYPAAMRQMVLMNPLREPRLIWRSLRRFEHAMTDYLQVAVSMACFQIRPSDGGTEFLLNIAFGGAMEIDGRRERMWHVRTNVGERLCLLTDTYVAAYECVQPTDNPPMPKFGDAAGMAAAIKDGCLARFKGPSVGKQLSRVPHGNVTEAIELAKSYQMAAGLDLLLRRAGIDGEKAKATPIKIETGPFGNVGHWLVVADRRAYLMEAASKGSALLEMPDRKCVATIRKPEIEEHLAKAEAGNFAVT